MVSAVRPHLLPVHNPGHPQTHSRLPRPIFPNNAPYSLRLLVQSNNRFYPDIRYLPEKIMGQVDINCALL
jgi:hypothetical protein